MTMPLQHAYRIPPPADLPSSRLARPSRSDRSTFAASDAVNTALDLLDLHRLSPMEFRVLLAVRDRERAETELARSLGRPAATVRRSAAALYARGYLRWRYARDDDSLFALTPSGKMILRPLLGTVRNGQG